jgi:Signal transduction histidine kinase
MQSSYESKQSFKYIFLITAIIIALASVLVTNVLVRSLSKEERKKIELWANAVKLMSVQTGKEESGIDPDIFNDYDNLILQIVNENTIPLLLTDDNDSVMLSANIKVPEQNGELFLKKKAKEFKKKRSPIVLDFDDGTYQYVYYDDSTVLKRLQLFPYVQLGIVSVFIIVSFLALSSSKKAEQNKVWVGLSKETAHQLGTPISSLMAWVEYLKTKNIDTKLLAEMDKDVQRLKTIAERFSKIGSNPSPEPMDLVEVMKQALDYMSKRISSKVIIQPHFPDRPILVLMNESLFGWVIENLIKNAIDAMNGEGMIDISIIEKGKYVKIDITDTGKGIPKSKFDLIFQPGYTTKERGWGLGLSLVRRIIESYLQGKIYVLRSELNKGSTFRVELKPYIS